MGRKSRLKKQRRQGERQQSDADMADAPLHWPPPKAWVGMTFPEGHPFEGYVVKDRFEEIDSDGKKQRMMLLTRIKPRGAR